MWPGFINTLSWWQWIVLAAVPPAIILLYFLKLKRRPIEVPSTYLWHKSIEDLHVNSIWQRLRNNLLLLLQLLLLLLVAAALSRPNWRGTTLSGDRFIFLVDNSASMQATDVGPSRLEEAKRQVGQLIDQMKSGDAAMIISFSDSARVEQNFTTNRHRLRRELAAIEPTQRSTSLLEALRVASGLANPGRSAEDDTDYQVAEAMPADLYIFSDGKFAPVTGFSLGNLRPIFVSIGDPSAANLGITAFSVRRNEADRELYQAFARLENFGPEDVTVSTELLLDDRLKDADRLRIAAGKSRPVAFDLGAVESGVLKVRIDSKDNFSSDDVAYTVLSPPRRVKVLLVTAGNEALEWTFDTELALEVVELATEHPDFLNTKEYLAAAAAGAYDLVIYDRCRAKQMPQCNTLFIGSLPSSEGWAAGAKVDVPQIIDIETAHPLLQWLDLGDVILLEGTPLSVPPGGAVLIDTGAGPMMAVAPRERFEDAVLGFEIVGETDGAGEVQRYFGTSWPTRPSFAAFMLNVFDYLAGSRGTIEAGNLRPGKPLALDIGPSRAKIRVRTPKGETVKLSGGSLDKPVFSDTGELGIYEVQVNREAVQRFAVNLFDQAESAICPDPNQGIKIGYVEVKGESGWEAGIREIWKVLLLLGVAVLLFEWYMYNRRVRL